MKTKVSKVLIDKDSVVKRVLKQVRTHIIMNKYPAGSRLPEIDMAATYNTSRGTIRTVLQELSNEGLVEFLDNGGCVVVGIDEKTIRDIYSLRMLLEVAAAEAILANPQPSILPLAKVMDLYTKREEDPLYHTNIQEFYIDLDLKLHQAFVSLAQNRPMLRAWNSMSAVIRDLLLINLSDEYQEEFIEKFYDHHQILLDYAILKNPKLVDEIKGQIEKATELSVKKLALLRNTSLS